MNEMTINRSTYTRDDLARIDYEKLAHDIATKPYDESLISMTSDIVTDILTFTPLLSNEYLWLPLFALVPSNEIIETLNSLRPLTSTFPWLYSKIGNDYAVELVTLNVEVDVSTLEEFLVSGSYEEVVIAMLQLINAYEIIRSTNTRIFISEIVVFVEKDVANDQRSLRVIIITTLTPTVSSTNIATILYRTLKKMARGGDRDIYGLLARIYTTIVDKLYEEVPLLIARGYSYDKLPTVIPETYHTANLLQRIISLINYHSDSFKEKKSIRITRDMLDEKKDSRVESSECLQGISKYLLRQRPDTYRSFRLAGYVPRKNEEDRALTTLTAEIDRIDSFSLTESLSLLRTTLRDIQWVHSLSDSCNDDRTTQARTDIMMIIEEKIEALTTESDVICVL